VKVYYPKDRREQKPGADRTVFNPYGKQTYDVRGELSEPGDVYNVRGWFSPNWFQLGWF
jgi:hypothetical protein